MCGISGIINKKNSAINETELRRINGIISHRGPDSDGFFTAKNLGFGHRRLSILDLSELGHQPMSYLNKYWITYNGEIYNYIEVRNELTGLGYHFKSETDTEVILAAYHCWGYECFSKFNGMWAFAIYDIDNNTVVFCRDRFGIKPLYYKEDEENFYFGSEIKQLLNETSNKVNEKILLESLLTHIDNHTTETYFDGIYALPQSHYMIYNLDNHKRDLKRYYTIKKIEGLEKKTDDDLINEFSNILHDSIMLRLRSDVIVGTSLSGGLDSSAVSRIGGAEYTKKTQLQFKAINAKSIDASNDESAFAKIVSDYSNLDLHVVTPTYENFVKTIDDVVKTQEEPFGSPSMFMGWHVFQKARQENCIVMLNGQGSDEVLLGYERYFTSTFDFKNPLKQLKEIKNQNQNSRLSLFHTIAYYFYFRSFNIRKARLKKKTLVKKEFVKDHLFDAVKRSSASYSNSFDLQKLEVESIQLPHLLRYEDRNSMRHSIETRLPFLDYRLVEMTLSLPLRMKIRNGWTKYILRKAIDKLLPHEIVWRKNKFGFESPDKIWLTKHKEQMLQDVMASKLLNHYCDMKAVADNFRNMSRKDQWMYFNIARWEKVFNVTV